MKIIILFATIMLTACGSGFVSVQNKTKKPPEDVEIVEPNEGLTGAINCSLGHLPDYELKGVEVNEHGELKMTFKPID